MQSKVYDEVKVKAEAFPEDHSSYVDTRGRM